MTAKLKVMKQVQSEDLRVVFVDVFKCKSPIDFAETVASAVLSQTASKAEEFVENAKAFLGRINLGINLSPDIIYLKTPSELLA